MGSMEKGITCLSETAGAYISAMSDTSHTTKPIRVLSCVMCQQRKVRCDRTFPCTNCIKSKAQCIPAGLLPRRRKRRFPERELLDRLRQYETLLRQNDIEFDPLHPEPGKESDGHQTLGSAEPEDRDPTSRVSSSSRPKSSSDAYEAKDLWNAVNQTSPESDEEGTSSPAVLPQEVVKKVWDRGSEPVDPLFGGQNNPVDLSSQHPETPQIFRLWQIYLDNVDPLLKVTHTPTLQGRIVEAIANLKGITPPLEALMFGIYCMAILSLMPDDCEARLGTPKDELLSQYQRSCRQALINCGFLRSDDRECLTALFFYLMSMRPTIGDPRTLSTVLGIAIRTAKRMGLHSESQCAKFPPLEAELRRRLWWALVLFDARIGEMADYRATTLLTPLWDCKIPTNVSDFDLRPDMKDLPAAQGRSSEALFLVTRYAMADCIRNFSFHLDFICPPLKAVAREIHRNSGQEYCELDALEAMMEERYFRFCDPENPLHSLTILMARGWLAKCRLFEYYSRYSAGRQSNAQRDTASLYALTMLDCDTKILSNVGASRYLWLVHMYFPFPAYIHLLQDSKRRPLNGQTERSWNSLSENFEARSNLLLRLLPGAQFCALSGIIIEAWESTESALRQSGRQAPQPKIVTFMKSQLAKDKINSRMDNSSSASSFNDHSAAWSNQLNMNLNDPLSTTGGNSAYDSGMWMPVDLPGQSSFNNVLTSADWSMLNWGM
ncbi:hypothetical protein BDV11DRAFT_216578 [Aspergillus similis]